MSDLKLIALDSDDLSIISAHLQDAVLRVADMTFIAREKRFVAILNRFDWTNAHASGSARAPASGGERRRAGLRFERVKGAKLQGINLTDKQAVLSLLAITFSGDTAGEVPDGDVTLTFSGGAAIRLSVECIEAELKDLGAAWSARSVPEHPEE